MEFWKAWHHKFCETTLFQEWRNTFIHSEEGEGGGPAYYGICLTLWWPNTTIKLNLHVSVETLHTEVLLWRLKHMKMEYMYFQSWTSLLVMNEANRSYYFWLHSVTTRILIFICPCFAHIGPQPSFTSPPTLSSIPLICTHWIQNPSEACAWDDTKWCHKICFITNATQAKTLT